MTEIDAQRQHENYTEGLAWQLTAWIDESIGKLTNLDEERRPPLLCRAKFEFSIISKRPGERVGPTPFETLVKQAAKTQKDLMKGIYREVELPQEDPAAFANYPLTFSGLVFPSSNEGGGGTFEALYVNSLMIAPRSQKHKFKDFFSRGLPRSGFSARGLSLKDMQIQEIENSEDDIVMAVEHILKFVASWPPIVDRDDFNIFVPMLSYLELSR